MAFFVLCHTGVKIQKSGTTHLWDHVLKKLHDLGALGLLVVGEAASHNDHQSENKTQVQLHQQENAFQVILRIVPA